MTPRKPLTKEFCFVVATKLDTMDQKLSAGVLKKILDGRKLDEPIQLQFLGCKPLSNDRYRLRLSDGVTITSYSLMTAEYNSLIEDGSLTDFAVCRITNYLLTKPENVVVPVMMIKEIEVVVPGEEIGEVLGNPVAFESKARNSNPVEQNLENHPDQNLENHPDQNVNQENGVLDTKQKRCQVQTQLPVPENNITTVPIMSLSPYYGRWTIRARVAAKTDIRYWNNARGEGKLFSMDLIDESGEIKCSGFKEQVDRFYDLLQEGSIYYITKCQVKLADKRYSSIKNEFELVLNSDSSIFSYNGDFAQIPMRQFDFSPIDQIEFEEANRMIDVLAIVKSVGEVIELKSKATGQNLKKRDVLLVDNTNSMVSLTLWGAQAEHFNVSDHTVIAIKSIRVTEFNGGKSLTTLSSTTIQANPDIPETERLLEWFNDSDQAQNAKLLSSSSAGSSCVNCPWLTFHEADKLNIGTPGTFNTFITKATVNLINAKNCVYKSCPAEGCKKKLLDPVNGMYRCEKCQIDFPNYVYRMIVQAILFDWTGEQRVTLFGEEAEKIIGMNAEKLGQLHETLSTDAYNEIFSDCAFKSFNFKIRRKQETFKDLNKMKAVVLSVTPINDKEYGSFLIKQIKTLGKSKPS